MTTQAPKQQLPKQKRESRNQKEREKACILFLFASEDIGIVVFDIVRVPLRHVIADELLAQDLVHGALPRGVQHVTEYRRTCLRHTLQRRRRQDALQWRRRHRFVSLLSLLSLLSSLDSKWRKWERERCKCVVSTAYWAGLFIYYKFAPFFYFILFLGFIVPHCLLLFDLQLVLIHFDFFFLLLFGLQIITI